MVRGHGGPSVLYARNSQGEIVVKLDTEGTSWCQYAYQFSYLFADILCGFDEKSVGNKWFEVGISEAASLFVLKQMSQTWEREPPYPNWKEYRHALAKYAQNAIDQQQKLEPEGLPEFYQKHRQELARGSDTRPLSHAMAVALLKVFEERPEHWEAIRWLNQRPSPKDEPFEKYLQRWHDAVPPPHQPFVAKLARLFGLAVAPAVGSRGPAEKPAATAKDWEQWPPARKLLPLDKGGLLQPVSVDGTTWLRAEPQTIKSLGLIAWYGDKAEARAVARKSGKPLLIISTELPGCSACTGLGANLLSNLFVVDAATEFVPLVVDGGWPALMFQDATGQELAPKLDRQATVGATLKNMVTALRAAARPVPAYLDLLAGEYAPGQREQAVFKFGCFWEGQAALGKLPGVLATQAGALGGEVVEVAYDAAVMPYDQLVAAAGQMKCLSGIIPRDARQLEIAKRSCRETVTVTPSVAVVKPAGLEDEKHQLRNARDLYYLPLTELQATKLNSLGEHGVSYLSPSQSGLRELLRHKLGGQKAALDLQPDRSEAGVTKYAVSVKQLVTPATAISRR